MVAVVIPLLTSLLLQTVGPTDDDPARSTDCGVHCLFVAMKALDSECPITLDALRKSLSPGPRGNSLEQLRAEAERRGFQSAIVRPSLETLAIRSRPFLCIAHLSRGHFVIVKDVAETTVTISDPPLERTLPQETFRTEWSGACLLLARTPLELELSLQRRLYWMRILKMLPGVLAVLVTGMILTQLIRRRFRSERLS
jgi:ABC-type bacteriocin/lantibiotic exporter with double-glycine peptidase domain